MLISLIHTFVNIPALIRKRSVCLSSRAGIFTKVWIGDMMGYNCIWVNIVLLGIPHPIYYKKENSGKVLARKVLAVIQFIKKML